MQKFKNLSRVCILLCTTVVYNTVHSSSDYLPFYPTDKHQIDAVYWSQKGALRSGNGSV